MGKPSDKICLPMKLLITGFEPFGNSPINPSQLLIENLASNSTRCDQLAACLLPVDTVLAPKKIIEQIVYHNPQFIVCLGQASGRAAISLEKIAINLLDFRIPDNQGHQVQNQEIVRDGSPQHLSSLPIELLQKILLSSAIPCEISFSAGAYLCNQIFYSMMHHIAINNLNIQAGFIHLPALPEQVSNLKKPLPSMSLITMLLALDKIIEVLIKQ